MGEVSPRPNMILLHTLKYREVIEAISSSDKVYYRHGVWNSYTLKDAEYVKKAILKSGYGADLRRSGSDGMFYVSIPSDGDMW